MGVQGRTVGAAAAALWTGAALGQAAQASLVDLSLEELGHVAITSAAKREQRLAEVPAAIFVISADDIRRSGAVRLPEVLRMAPNLHVAAAYTGGYAISARGFNASGGNKMLVLIDGRSVYAPLFAGVFWDVQDLPLSDIERIEVSSGPGGTLWGANAVNGVVNVITRSAVATRGSLVSVAVGEQERSVVLRQGWPLGNGGDMRVFVKRTDQDATATAAGARVDDAGHMLRAGFRADWGRGGSERFTLQGHAYRGNHGQPLPGSVARDGFGFAPDTIRLSGAHLLARWERPLGAGELSLQGYLDHSHRANPPAFDASLGVADLELQYTLQPAPAHTLLLGANHRRSRDHVGHGAPESGLLPERLSQAWTSLYAQDEIALGDALRLTLGGRIERNGYTGSELLPNLRLAWKPARGQLWWASAARTARAPSRLDRGAHVPARPPFPLDGGPGLRSETAEVLELGYRGQPLAALTLSATAFHGRYDHLRTQELAPGGNPVVIGNGMRGRVAGVEGWASVQAAPRLRLHAGLTLLRPRLQLRPDSRDTDASVPAAEGAMPRRQWRLRAAFELPRDAELDLTLRHVGALSAPAVPAYTALDLRIGGRLRPGTDLSLAARNLLGGHGEFSSVQARTEFGRHLMLHLRIRF